MAIRALIVDDEPLARRAIRRFLSKDAEIAIIGECGDGESAVGVIRELKPDLLFLDIQMPEMDGFEVLHKVGAERMPVTIFVTAYDQFALRAFDANAIDYLLKPVANKRFERSLERAKHRIARKHSRDEMSRMVSSLQRLAKAQQYVDRLGVPLNGRILFVATKDIDWIEAEGNYLHVHAGNREHILRQTLTEVEKQLNPNEFLRIHRSTIVNVRRIKEIQPWFHGYHRVLLENGKELRMSRYQHEVARQLRLI